MALDILDYVVDFSNKSFTIAVSQKTFISFMISILKMKDSPEQQLKILGLLQKWGLKYENDSEVQNFHEIYKSLKNNGVTFPSYYK